MTFYANDNKSWYPVMPECTSDGFLNRQDARGGLAGLFSLHQNGPTDDGNQWAGWTGASATDDNDLLDCYFSLQTTSGTCLELPTNGLRTPLLRNYMTGFDVLLCPSDKADIYYGPASTNTWEYTTTAAQNGSRIPRVAGSERDVAWNTISYLYTVGLKTDEPNIPYPPPIWGDETNGPDLGTKAWYGASANGTTLNSSMADAGVRNPGGYGKVDNHGVDGANFVYADGHSSFVTGSIQSEFFSDDPQAQKSVNVVKRGRSALTQTID